MKWTYHVAMAILWECLEVEGRLARKGSEETIRGRLRKEAETIMGLRSPRADEAAGSERGRDQGPTAREDGF